MDRRIYMLILISLITVILSACSTTKGKTIKEVAGKSIKIIESSTAVNATTAENATSTDFNKGIKLVLTSEKDLTLEYIDDYSLIPKTICTVLTYSNGKTSRDEPGSPWLTWTSSQPQIASVDGGQVFAKASGNAIITAKYQDLSISVNVNVIKSKYVNFKIDDKNELILDKLLYGEKSQNGYRLFACLVSQDGTKKDATESNLIKWTSSNEKVATVSSRGEIRAISAGTVKVKAKCLSFEQTINITIKDSKPFKMICKTNKIVLEAKGYSETAKVVVVLPDGTEEDVTKSADFLTDNENIVIAYDGSITAMGKGSAIVTIQYLGFTKKINVSVLSNDPPN